MVELLKKPIHNSSLNTPLIYEIGLCRHHLLSVIITSAQCQQTTNDWFDKGVALDSQGKYDESS